jgi:hypothetical protein
MELLITPFESVGPIQFGATPAEVQAAVNAPWQTFLKDLEDPTQPTDAFDSCGLHVHYELGKCVAVECFDPAVLFFQGRQLTGQRYREIKTWLELIDPHIKATDSGIQARSLGIELYAPNYSELERPDEVVECVMVVDRNYFEKTDALLAAHGLLP